MAGASSEPPAAADNGYEVVVGGNARGEGGRILGHRAFARYYKQKYRSGDGRRSVAVINSVLAKCAHPLFFSLSNYSLRACLPCHAPCHLWQPCSGHMHAPQSMPEGPCAGCHDVQL